MILGRDIHPERKVYHTGTLVLEVLKESQAGRVAYFELYAVVRKNHGLSLNIFNLTLNWLFLLGVVEYVHGEVENQLYETINNKNPVEYRYAISVIMADAFTHRKIQEASHV